MVDDAHAAGTGGLPLGSGLGLLLLVALIVLNAIFVAAEFALVRSRPGRLRALARQGTRGAQHALFLVEHLSDAVAVCQVGVTLCSLALGYLGEPALAHLITKGLGGALGALPWVGRFALTISIAISFLLVTVLLVVLGELVPKQLAIVLAEKIAVTIALPVRLFRAVAWPLVAVLNGMARVVVRMFRLPPQRGDASHSREELMQLLVVSAQAGQIGALETTVMQNLFRFSQKRTRDAMVPRSRAVVLDVTRPPEELRARARAEGYSRYPLVERDLDRVVGVVHVKDFPERDLAGLDVRRLARTATFVPDTLPLDRLLRRFQADRSHLAIVMDEYGAVTGIVTLEDVLEELVGEVRDEFDAEEQDPVRPRPGGGFELDATLPIDRAAELVVDPPEAPEGVYTIAGLLQAELGRLPATGDRVPFGKGHELVASAVQGTRLLRVELVPRVES